MKKILAGIGLICLTTSTLHAQNFNPRPNWKDSYSVGGRCYCDSNGFDHGLDRKSAPTPIGTLNVVQICEDIEDALGTGPGNGRIPYNDIQCGNGPANDAADEAGCPGRVDIGSAGCNVIGPKWDLDAVYGNVSTSLNPEPAPAPPPTPTPEPTSTPTGGSSASNNSGAVGFATDGNRNTRWTTERSQRSGQWFQLDLGRTQTVGSVILDSAGSPNDGPATYTLSTSTDGRNFSNAASGNGGAVTTVNFNSRSARYIRITQSGSKSKYWWSIHEITVNSDSNNDSNDSNDSNNNSGDGFPTRAGNWVQCAVEHRGGPCEFTGKKQSLMVMAMTGTI